MEKSIESIILITLSGVVIPTVYALIVTVFMTRRHDSHIKTIFRKLDNKAESSELEKIEKRQYDADMRVSENVGKMTVLLDRFESVERRMEGKLQ